MVGFITNYLWLDEMGYTSVFFKQLVTQLELGVPTFIIITALTYMYLMAIKRGYSKKVDTTEGTGKSDKTIKRIALGLSAFFGFSTTVSAVTNLWFEVLQFTNAPDFNIVDPIFHKDIGF